MNCPCKLQQNPSYFYIKGGYYKLTGQEILPALYFIIEKKHRPGFREAPGQQRCLWGSHPG